MSQSMIINEKVLFQSKAEKVWDLLINPNMTKRYMFGCEVLSDWKIGSPVHWKGKTEDGVEVIYVKGEVLEYQEGKKVTSSTFDPNADMADIPENYVNLTYELTESTEGTLLTIIQGDFAGAENGKKRYEESRSGWKDIVIPMMKSLLNE